MVRTILIGMALALAASTARAAPVADTAEWAQRFTETALKSNPADILARAQEVADSRLNLEGLRGALDKISVLVGTQPGEYAEQFDQRTIGTFLRRINIVVRYPKTFMFYSLVFVRSDAGWEMVQFNYNTNINEVLKLGWPE